MANKKTKNNRKSKRKSRDKYAKHLPQTLNINIHAKNVVIE